MSTAHLSKLPPATPQGEPVVAHLGARLQVTGRNLTLAGAPCGALLTLARRSDARESVQPDAGMAVDADCWWPDEHRAAARLHTLLARPRQVLEYLGAVPLVEPNVPTRTDLLRRRSEFKQLPDGSYRQVAVIPERAPTGRRYRPGYQAPRPVAVPEAWQAQRDFMRLAEPRYTLDLSPIAYQGALPLPADGDGIPPASGARNPQRSAAWRARVTGNAQQCAVALLAVAHPWAAVHLLAVWRPARQAVSYRLACPADSQRGPLMRAIRAADDAGLPTLANRLRQAYRRTFAPAQASVQRDFEARQWSNLMRHSR